MNFFKKGKNVRKNNLKSFFLFAGLLPFFVRRFAAFGVFFWGFGGSIDLIYSLSSPKKIIMTPINPIPPINTLSRPQNMKLIIHKSPTRIFSIKSLHNTLGNILSFPHILIFLTSLIICLLMPIPGTTKITIAIAIIFNIDYLIIFRHFNILKM